jgi:hypothetical protein
MRSSFVLLPLVALVGACGTGTVTATVLDGLTGVPLPGERIVLRGPPDASASCQVFEGTTGADGVAVIEGPCLAKVDYRVTFSNELLWLFEGGTIPAGSDGTISLAAFHVPAGSGIYEHSGTSLIGLPTHADLKTEPLWESTETVRFPSALPAEAEIPRVEAGEYLVIAGADNIAGAQLFPLIRSEEPRKFGNATQWSTMQPWWYVGTAFTSDTEFTRVEAALDLAKVHDRAAGERAARSIPSDALPPGRYALQATGSRRVTIIDFGAAPPAAPAAE